jgi:hypothetical protein
MAGMSPRERRLAFWVLVLLLAGVVQIGFVRPATRKIRRLRARVIEQVTELNRVRTVIARKAAVSAAYGAIRTRITSSRSPEREIIDMLLTIEKAALDAGVQIQKNIHLRDESLEFFNRHTVHFTGRGKPENLFRMIHSLQHPDLLLRIPRIEFAMKEHELEMELEITRVVCAPDKAG